jgi:hypothetical protein
LLENNLPRFYWPLERISACIWRIASIVSFFNSSPIMSQRTRKLNKRSMSGATLLTKLSNIFSIFTCHNKHNVWQGRHLIVPQGYLDEIYLKFVDRQQPTQPWLIDVAGVDGLAKGFGQKFHLGIHVHEDWPSTKLNKGKSKF